MKLKKGSALLFVVLITSACAVYVRHIIQSAQYSVACAHMRSKHIHNQYILSGFVMLAVNWAIDRYDVLITAEEGAHWLRFFDWPSDDQKYRVTATITKQGHRLCIVVESEGGFIGNASCTVKRKDDTGAYRYYIEQCASTL